MKRSADVRQPPQAAPAWTLGPRWLVAASLFAACLVALPILAVVLNLFQPAGDAWGHVAGSVVPNPVSRARSASKTGQNNSSPG